MIDNEYLVTGYFKKQNLTLTNMPIFYWSKYGFELHDPHWIAVILMNHNKTNKLQTVDYLEYTNAKNGYASLYNLPKNDKIKIVF